MTAVKGVTGIAADLAAVPAPARPARMTADRLLGLGDARHGVWPRRGFTAAWTTWQFVHHQQEPAMAVTQIDLDDEAPRG
jgi:hypothetical protein